MYSWPHAPARLSHEGGAVFVTASTYLKKPLFKGEERLELLQSSLFELMSERGYGLDAWAFFPNHYHVIVRTEGMEDLGELFRRLHGRTSVALNRMDDMPGRKVWHNFRDTTLTNANSYFARLHYVHANAVHHGIVAEARMYPYASAHWFETQGEEAFVRTVYSFKIDRINVEDDF